MCVMVRCMFCQFCICSLGFFGPRRREQLSDDKFAHRGSVSSHRGSVSSLNAVIADAQDDTKSVVSMDELYMPKSRPEVSKFCIKQSMYPVA